MAYSDFTLDRLIQEFGVEIVGERSMLAEAPPVEASSWLQESLKRANNTGFGSEKSRSERLVSPILLELSNRNQDAFAIISGANLDIDPSHGLNGECDFILSFTRLQDLVRAPVFCITEAKKQDVELGTAQCAAQLLGATRLNEREKKIIPTLYGCSTTGVEWRFLRFEANTFVLDETRYLISDLPKLLGVLQQIINWQMFALNSLPLEGIYFSEAHPDNFDYSFDALRFYRDGTFLEVCVGSSESSPDVSKIATWFTKQQHQGLGGHYTVIGRDLQLYFEFERSSSNFYCNGSVDADGGLLVNRHTKKPPILLKKRQFLSK